MTVTIQFTTAEDFKLVEPLLRLFKEHGVKVSAGLATGKGKPGKKPKGLARSLHGILHLPEDFDYTTFMADEILKRHAGN